MVVQDIHIESCNWDARIFYAVTRYDVDAIMQALHRIGCRSQYAAEAYDNLMKNELNSGLTFSNYNRRCSVVVVALYTSAKQFHRCLTHELRHLQSHIASADGMSEKSEKVCYLLDEIVGLVHDTISPMLCECCSNKHRHGYEKARQRHKKSAYGARMPMQGSRSMLSQLRQRRYRTCG